ncbi:unnamed protein product [Brugia pahangi]|uniref:Uncharacterized protein n=1 Tax=Brugia pahangi TaxID=6280 RepID=A0A0N4TKT6_BRUPA|nr:unnamed protein product [Brugia pahangi]
MEKANWFADANCDFSKNSRSTMAAVVVEAVVNVRSLTRGICEEIRNEGREVYVAKSRKLRVCARVVTSGNVDDDYNDDDNNNNNNK